MAITGEVLSAVGALGLGSVLGQWLSGGRDRRQARANVLGALADVEIARWAGSQAARDYFSNAARQFRTACLLARIPRRMVREYLILAQAAFWLSMQSIERERGNDPETAGAINVYFAELVENAAGLLADVIWAPGPYRWLISHRVKKKLGDPYQSKASRESLDMLDRSRKRGLTV